jgi:hypothetical protein
MSAPLSAPRVPAEFDGLARQFRAEVDRIDKQMSRALAVITGPLRSRVRRHPKLRHEHIVQAERLYRSTVPPDFRIGEVEVNRDRAAFAVSETRLSLIWMNDIAWQDTTYREPGVALCDYVMRLADGTFS